MTACTFPLLQEGRTPLDAARIADRRATVASLLAAAGLSREAPAGFLARTAAPVAAAALALAAAAMAARWARGDRRRWRGLGRRDVEAAV